MKVLVLGATGRTGGLVVDYALARGYEVRVLVRPTAGRRWAGVTPGSRSEWPDGVQVVKGDVLDSSAVQRAVEGQDAVVQCVGGQTPWVPQTMEREAMRYIVAAMKASGARRLVVLSAMGSGRNAKQAPWWYRWLVVPTFLRGVIKDKNAMEIIVRGSGLDWVLALAPFLTDGPKTGRLKVLEKGETGSEVRRADLAAWMVEQLESRAYVGQAVVMVTQ
jgi:uncharacterized protein YbjT (DUF2867 family)